jgi:hypothetical protein
MVHHLKTSHASSIHQYAPQEDYSDYHEGDTDEKILMEAPPVAAHGAIVVSDDEEDPEEVIPKEEEQDGQQDQEEQAPDDHHEQVEEEEVQEQAEQQDPVGSEPAERVKWEVDYYWVDGVGIPMVDHLRAMVLRLGYDKTPVYCCELRTHPWFEPHWRVAAILQDYVPFHGVKDTTRHDDVAQRSTMEACIAEEAQRALYVLSHRERDKLKDTHCKYTPYRASGEAKTYITPAPAYEGTLNNVRRLLAIFNTALDDTNNTLHAAQQQIITLELQKHALEAALLNKEQPVVEDTMEACTSPSPKRPRYDSHDARTEDMPWEDSP